MLVRPACAVSCIFVLLLTCLPEAAAAAAAFRIGIEMPMQIPVSKQVVDGLKDIGINYINYYVYNGFPRDQEKPAAEVNEAGMALADTLGADFSISGCSYDPPDDCVKAAAERYKGTSRFRGVLIDELEWVSLLRDYSPRRLADQAKFKSFDQAYKETLEGYRKINSKFEALGTNLTATHVWPVMHHISSRAGCTVCPKICKEFYSTVSLAIGMGAAKQYGRPLWVDCDMWYWDVVPGHTPEEVKSNLLLAYWLGADLVYLEGCGYNLRPAGNQGTPFSLMNTGPVDRVQLTPIGEALKWFCKDYLPKNPRPWTFRDVKPSVAIVRFEDTCYGQRYIDGSESLYNSPNLRCSADTEAWFQIWNLLTFGKTGRDGISFFKCYIGGYGWDNNPSTAVQTSYASRPLMTDSHRFFCPLNGVVVYDHLADYDLLKDVPLIFLTGLEVSAETMEAIRKCVRNGAVCVAWGPLARKQGFTWSSGTQTVTDGKGKFVITDDFCVPQVWTNVYNLVGRADEIRYRFGSKQVVLHRKTDNEVDVAID